MIKLQPLWEDNSDTPLSTNNLSKFTYLYKEYPEMFFIDPIDNRFKIRANSKFSMKTPITKTFFKFDKSLSNHDSDPNFTPIVSNSVFRREGVSESEKYSLAIEEGSTNLLVNSNFDAGLSSWAVETSSSFSSATLEKSNESLFGANSLKIEVSGFPHPISISQSVILPSSEPNSFSFYYKSNSDLKVAIIAAPFLTPRYWRNDLYVKDWVYNESYFNVPSSGGLWKRYELKNIIISGQSPVVSSIKVVILADTRNEVYYINDVKLEEKSFCTSYVKQNKLASIVKLNKDSVRAEQGSIDLQLNIKNFNIDENSILNMMTGSENAFRLYLNTIEKKLVFSVRNTKSNLPLLEQNYIKNEYNFTAEDYKSLIDKWIRIIVSWDFTLANKEIKMFIDIENNGSRVLNNNYYISPLIEFDYHKNDEFKDFYLGCSMNSSSISNSLFKNLKTNLYSKSTQLIYKDFSLEILPDKDVYRIFEIQNYNFIIDSMFNENYVSGNYILYLEIDPTDPGSCFLKIRNTNEIASSYEYFIKYLCIFNLDDDIKVTSFSDLFDLNKEYVQLKIENSVPLTSGRPGEIRIVKTSSETYLITYISGFGWRAI